MDQIRHISFKDIDEMTSIATSRGYEIMDDSVDLRCLRHPSDRQVEIFKIVKDDPSEHVWTHSGGYLQASGLDPASLEMFFKSMEFRPRPHFGFPVLLTLNDCPPPPDIGITDEEFRQLFEDVARDVAIGTLAEHPHTTLTSQHLERLLERQKDKPHVLIPYFPWKPQYDEIRHPFPGFTDPVFRKDQP